MVTRLDNYLRTYRRQAGLSQAELAFLLGCRDGAQISRYERRTRQPSIRVVLGLEVIFRIPVRELFAGRFDQIRCTTAERAGLLVERLGGMKPNRQRKRKLEVLQQVRDQAHTRIKIV
jgi:transcriptional regulator with XRE-family HTH domain